MILPILKFSILATLLWVALIYQTHSLEFNFEGFKDENGLIVSRNSTIFRDAIQVTPDTQGMTIANMSGRTLYKTPFRLWSNKNGKKLAAFNTTFTLNIKNVTDPGGEGLTFLLTADGNVPPGSEGQWLGLVNSENNGSAQAQVVAIEFDTKKSYSSDLDDNHIGLDVNSVYSIRQVSLNTIGVQLDAGLDIKVLVRYDGKNISVFIGNETSPALNEAIDLSQILPETVFVGFSGSTSTNTQLNCVKSWEFIGDDFARPWPWWIWVVLSVVILVLISFGFVAYWLMRRKKTEDLYPNIEEEIKFCSSAPKKFRLKELKKATGGFSPHNKLGKGGFGTVYKGLLPGNKEVAVKRVSKKSTQGKQEFVAEVTTIGNLHHRNLVRLIGWCYESLEFLLVYEYMPNGSLDKFIFSKNKSSSEEQTNAMSWVTRVHVISGVAQALDYLHHGCDKRVLHRDVKASNVMLDSEYNPKLGDFGLARTIEQNNQTHHSTKEIAGTPGYMAPEFILTKRATPETDVYAFGVLILETACGRRPAGKSEQNDYDGSIVNWVWELHRRAVILEAADPRLNGDFKNEEMETLLVLGLTCCHPNRNKRPSMEVVLQVLKGEAPAPDVPSDRPAFIWPPLDPSFKDLDLSLGLAGQLTPFSVLSGR